MPHTITHSIARIATRQDSENEEAHEEACCREGEVHDDRLAAGLVLGPTCNVVAVYNTASGAPT